MVRTNAEIQDMIEQYVTYLNKEIKVQKVILYGSYAKGTPSEDSDIDIAVESADFGEDYLAECQRLQRSVWRSGIDPAFEPLPIHAVMKNFFREEIFKTGKILYQAE